MAGQEKSVKTDLHFVKKFFKKSLLAHFGSFSASQSSFRHSKWKRCTEDNVLTVGKRGDSYFFTVSNLPSHNSLNYELLSLTAICGEVPCAGSSRLTASESYRKKVVTSLTHDKLLRIFSSHHLRGYRLGVRTKRLLLQQEPECFAFYLSGCSDTNAIKSEVPRRIRLHRIAQTYVTMLNAGTMIYRDEKPPIFSPAASGPFHIEQPYFYDSREMKEAELEMLKFVAHEWQARCSRPTAFSPCITAWNFCRSLSHKSRCVPSHAGASMPHKDFFQSKSKRTFAVG